jgi:predicted PurR-regulated permease PerM
VLATAGSAFAWLGREITGQASSLAARLPELAKDPARLTSIALPAPLEPFRDDVLKYAVELAQTAVGSFLHGLGSAVLFILVPIFAFYFLKDGPQMREALLDFFEGFSERRQVAGLFTQFHDLLSQYIRALLFLSVTVFVAYAVFYQVTGVPYALLLATLAAVLEIIPIAGWVSAALLSTLIAVFSGYPHWGWLIVFYLVFRMFQDYVMVPWLMSAGIELHAVAVLAAVIAGELVGGVPGMFLSIPALAAGRILWRHFSVSQVATS